MAGLVSATVDGLRRSMSSLSQIVVIPSKREALFTAGAAGPARSGFCAARNGFAGGCFGKLSMTVVLLDTTTWTDYSG